MAFNHIIEKFIFHKKEYAVKLCGQNLPLFVILNRGSSLRYLQADKIEGTLSIVTYS